MQSILLPKNYESPFSLKKDAIKNKLILEMGYSMYQRMDIKVSDEGTQKDRQEFLEQIAKVQSDSVDKIKSLSSKHSKDITEIKESYEKQLSNVKLNHNQELERTNKELGKVKLELQTLRDQLECKSLESQTKYREEYEQKLEHLRSTIHEIKNSHISESLELKKTYEEKIQVKYLEQISNQNKEIDTLKQRLFTISQEYDHYIIALQNEHATKLIEVQRSESKLDQLTSTKKGQIGENLVMEMISKSIDDAHITNVGKLAGAGDLVLETRGVRLMIEVKNKKTITKTDVEKFLRDFRDISYSGAIFISLDGKIPLKGSCKIEIIDNRVVCWIRSSNEEIIIGMIHVCVELSRVISGTGSGNSEMIIRNMTKKIETANAVMNGILKSIMEMERLLVTMRNNVVRGLQEIV